MWFKSNAELAVDGRDEHDMCFIQLHYTVLVHLHVAHKCRAIHPLDAENFTHAIVRLSSATDVADELLGRVAKPRTYDPWSEKKGQAAREAWRGGHRQLRDIHDYRNRLVHGRISMSAIDRMTGIIYFPSIGCEQTYSDWRIVTPEFTRSPAFRRDYASGHNILEDTWRRVLEYIETSWQRHLPEPPTKPQNA